MTNTNDEKWSPAGLSTTRIEAFSDGVFAIVITLLILDIRLPNLSEATVASELPRRLLALWPKVIAYAISFIIVGIYWVTHHNMFHYIRRSDRVLLWLNVLFLMCVAFIPFPASLLGQYGGQQVAVIIYGVCLILTGVALAALWWYATHRRRLVDDDIDPELVRLASRRILRAPVVYLISILLSFVSVNLSLVLYLLVPLLYIFPSRIDRHWSRLAHRSGQPDKQDPPVPVP